MIRNAFLRHVISAVTAIMILLPAIALAGKKVTSGQQSLQLSVSLAPALAGARVNTLSLHEDYLNASSNGQQPPYNSHDDIFTLPKGMTFHSSPTHVCRESAIKKSPKGAALCPASSKIGSGTVVVNARPTIPGLIHGVVTAFNGLDDLSSGSVAPKGSAAILLYVKTNKGIDTTDVFHLSTHRGSIELTAVSTAPSKPGIVAGDLTLQSLSLVTSSAGGSYFTNPATCSRSWKFAFAITNYFGQPSVSAANSVRCRA